MRAYMVSGLYERGTLFEQARPAIAERKAQASHRLTRKGHKPSACVTLRPDADGNMREVALEHRGKRVRWDVTGMFVERA